MIAVVSGWPVREPGRPYRWLLDVVGEIPAPTCVEHRQRNDRLGVCALCVSAWRRELGADPFEWTECMVCGFPLHPAAEVGEFDACPSCALVGVVS